MYCRVTTPHNLCIRDDMSSQHPYIFPHLSVSNEAIPFFYGEPHTQQLNTYRCTVIIIKSLCTSLSIVLHPSLSPCNNKSAGS